MVDSRDVREGWREVMAAAQRHHLTRLTEVRPVEARSIMQPDGYVYCVVAPDHWEAVPYTLESRAQVTLEVTGLARDTSAWAIGIVVQGVSPEENNGKVTLRPALLTTIMGLGVWEHWRLEIVQRIDLESHRVLAYGPLFRVSSQGGNGSWDVDSLQDSGADGWPRPVWERQFQAASSPGWSE